MSSPPSSSSVLSFTLWDHSDQEEENESVPDHPQSTPPTERGVEEKQERKVEQIPCDMCDRQTATQIITGISTLCEDCIYADVARRHYTSYSSMAGVEAYYEELAECRRQGQPAIATYHSSVSTTVESVE
jgi:ribosomal protein L37AE/L43A